MTTVVDRSIIHLGLLDQELREPSKEQPRESQGSFLYPTLRNVFYEEAVLTPVVRVPNLGRGSPGGRNAEI